MLVANHFESDLVLNERLLQVVAEGMSEALEVASAIAQYGKDDQQLTQTTKDTMLAFVHMENEIKQQMSALKHVKSMAISDDSPSNLTGVFKEKLTQLQASNSSDLDTLRTHAKYQELQMSLESSGTIENQLEALRQVLTGGGGEAADDSQQELAFTEAEVNTRCPYTGATMRDPVRNKRCGHVYDREGILSYIKQKRAKAKCPVGGCGNTAPVQTADLEDHRDMKRYITLMAQSQG